MANEFAVNRADLVSVADAIREKGETTESLSFPDGFVSAIQAISGGLSFEVVGGTAQPTNPKENTIWVSTNTEITSWWITSTDFSAGMDGMVWVKIGNTADCSVVIPSENGVVGLGFEKVMQYINGAWVDKGAAVYSDGEWHNLAVYLLRQGDPCTGITGGWVCTEKDGTGYNGPIAISSTANGLTATVQPNYSGMIRCANKIDLTDVNTIVATMQYTTCPTYVYLSVLNSLTLGQWQPSDIAASATMTNKNGEPVELDVSELEGEYYIVIRCAQAGGSGVNGAITVTEVKLL